MGCDDGGEFTDKGATSAAAAGGAAGNGGSGLAVPCLSILLGAAASPAPLGLVAERSSIEAVGWLLVDACYREWSLELERPRHKRPAGRKKTLSLLPSWTLLRLRGRRRGEAWLCCGVCTCGFV